MLRMHTALLVLHVLHACTYLLLHATIRRVIGGVFVLNTAVYLSVGHAPSEVVPQDAGSNGARALRSGASYHVASALVGVCRGGLY